MDSPVWGQMKKGVLLVSIFLLVLALPAAGQWYTQYSMGTPTGFAAACIPSAETCDGLDNDCDTEFDEGGVCDDSFSDLQLAITVADDCDLTGAFTLSNNANTIPASNIVVELIVVRGDEFVERIDYNPLIKNIAPGKSANVPFTIIPTDLYDSALAGSSIELHLFVLSLDTPATKGNANVPAPPGNVLVDICHFPLTSQGYPVTIHISQSALGPHFAHGDYLGECPDPNVGTSITHELDVCQQTCVVSSEVCDGIDNDCDGDIDEEILVACGLTDEGTCSFGQRTCNNGALTACVGEIIPDIEICNGLDDDCDGETDEDLLRTCGTDEGLCQFGEQQCTAGVWGECSGDLVNPTAEVCNGFDDDCNGLIDDGRVCDCNTGDTRSCGSDVGVCESGTQTCVSGQWGSCNGELIGLLEVCDGLDNDCDGYTDEELGETFGSDIGVCSLGHKECISGELIIVSDELLPSLEICDGLDNDCDGEIDEELYRSCGMSDLGACEFGLQVCTMGNWGACEGLVNPVFETCDGLDNDCDGLVDNDITDIFSGTNIGLCREEQQSCVNGLFSIVQSSLPPQAETCDGLDNDCNGLVDENIPDLITGTDTGYCISQIEQCTGGQMKIVQSSRNPRSEFCNAVDDDCDGLVDEELTCDCTEGETRTCGSNIGSCEKGQQTCTGGAWGSCEGMVDASSEVCDGLDNDCNGLVDESIVDIIEGSDVGVCQPTITSCTNGDMNIVQHKITSQPETCDGLDNDCDGLVDEDLPYEFVGSDEGACVSSAYACVDGNRKLIRPEQGSTQEVCDGIDNDCDGQIDEQLVDIIEGIAAGACVPKIISCADGELSIIQSAINPSMETCDGIDNDCDGLVDEEILNRVTGTNAGECQTMITSCTNGAFTIVQEGIEAADEVCDGLDNDCDGKIDDGIDCGCTEDDIRTCGSSVGVCQEGSQTCNNGLWGPCIGSIDATSEVCDGFDNDCDGEVDELLDTLVDGAGAGVCQPTITECTSGVIFTVQESFDPLPESCNGLDDDCNGIIDDGLRFVKETKDVGLCQPEIWDCMNGQMNLMQKEVTPITEFCDGFDNDCDGQVDEGCEPTVFPVAPLGEPGIVDQPSITPAPPTQPTSPVFRSKPSKKSKYITPQVDPFKQPLLQPRAFTPAAPTTASPGSPPSSVSTKPNIMVPKSITPDGPNILRRSKKSPKTGISLIMGQLPESISPTDPVISFPAVVKNTGTTVLKDIVAASAPVSDQWKGLNLGIDVLAPGEERPITFELRPHYCSNNLAQGDYHIPLSDIAIDFSATEADAVSDSKKVSLPLSAVPFLVTSPPKNFASDQTMKICYFVTNPSNAKKDRYEIEFELFDRQDDLIIDYLSPVRVENNEMLLKVRDYELAHVPRQKTYQLRGFLYENGSLFNSGYLVGEDRNQVDLSTVPLQRTGFAAVLQRLREVVS